MTEENVGQNGITRAGSIWMSNPCDKICEALLRVQAETHDVYKSELNRAQGWKYSRLEHYLDVIRPVLQANRVVVFSSVLNYSREVLQGKDPGKFTVFCHVEMEFLAMHESQWVRTVGVGDGMDYSGDKAAYKANTGARKYLLAMLGNTHTTDDPEVSRKKRQQLTKPPEASEAVEDDGGGDSFIDDLI